MSAQRNDHHILHNRKEWTLRPQARRLRQYPGLIADMDYGTHVELHQNCPDVPILGYYALLGVNKEYRDGRTTLQSMDNLLFAMEITQKSPTAHEIERALLGLAMQAVELQRPYVIEGAL